MQFLRVATESSSRSAAPPARAALPRRALVVAVLFSLCLGGGVFESVTAKRAEPLAAAHSRVAAHTGLSSVPVAAQGVVSAALGAHSPSYQVSRVSSRGLEARSVTEGLRMRFGLSGVEVRSGEAEVGLGLRAVGYGASARAVRAVAPTARANRVTYGRAGISEWYANGPLGLEQGFVLARPPRGPRAGAADAERRALAGRGERAGDP
jgi:trimeric autotransporter adhesin